MKFLKLDAIGITPVFYLYGKTHYQTDVGAFLTVTGILSIIGLSLYFTVQLFNRNELTVIFNSHPSKARKVTNLTDVPFPMAVFYRDRQGIPRTITSNSTVLQIDLFLDSYTLQEDGSYTTEKTDLSFKDCNQSDFRDYYPEGTNLEIYSMFRCLNTSRPMLLEEIDGDSVSIRMTRMLFNFKECTNGTGVICKPKAEIDEILGASRIVFHNLEHEIQHENETVPLRPYMKVHTFDLSNTIRKFLYFRRVDINYTTDHGFVLTDFRDKYGLTYEPHSESYSLFINKGIFFSMSFTNSDRTYVFKRSYAKMQYLLANIGGIVKAIMVTAIILNYILTSRLYYQLLANEFFDFESIDKQREMKSNVNSFNNPENPEDGGMISRINLNEKKPSEQALRSSKPLNREIQFFNVDE